MNDKEQAMIEELQRTPKRARRPQSDHDRFDKHLPKGNQR
jgi:hypothetical protein